jgi:hypothetical protein
MPKCSNCGNALTLAERTKGTTVCASCATASTGPKPGEVVRVLPPVAKPNTWLMVVEGPNPANPKELKLRRLPDDGRPADYTSKAEFWSRGHLPVRDTSETSYAFLDVAAFNDFFARA